MAQMQRGIASLRPKRLGYVPARFFFIGMIEQHGSSFRISAPPDEQTLYFALAHALLR
jgi:hypothetical protein